MFHGAGSRAPRAPRPGVVQWRVRQRNHTIISCELRDDGDPTFGVEVQKLKDGEWFYGRRWPDRASAQVEIDEMKDEQIAAGGTLLPGLD